MHSKRMLINYQLQYSIIRHDTVIVILSLLPQYHIAHAEINPVITWLITVNVTVVSGIVMIRMVKSKRCLSWLNRDLCVFSEIGSCLYSPSL